MSMKLLFIYIVLTSFSLSISANEMSEIMESKSLSERSLLFGNLLYISGKNCDRGTRTLMLGYDKEDSAYWAVSCNNGRSYIVNIPSDISANTRNTDCGILKLLFDIDCFEKWN